MRIPQLLLVLVAAIAAVLGTAVWLGDVGATPSTHPEHATMLRSGGARAGGALWLGWAFGALQIAFFGACFALGMRRPEGLGPLRGQIVVAVLLYELGWAGLILAYDRFVGAPSVPLVLAFPLPTALMLYLLWPLPLVFMWIYLRAFDSWFLREQDLARFRAILEEEESEASGPPDSETRSG